MPSPDSPTIREVDVGTFDAGSAAWREFRDADSARVYCERWLAYLQVQWPEIHGGIVLVADQDDDDFAPLARHPAGIDAARLADCADQALDDGGRELVTPSPDGVVLAFPVYVAGRLQALVLFDVRGSAQPDLRQQLRWSLAWIELLFLRRTAGVVEGADQPIYRALECVAAIVDKADFQTAANALVGELAAMFTCDRVALGLRQGESVRVVAISDTAVFGQQMNLVAQIEAAMDEAVDQGTALVWPPPDSNAFMVTLAHDALSQQAADSAICTLPLVARDEIVGALMLEAGNEQRFDERTVQLLDVVASLVAAPLVDRRDAERWLGGVAADRARTQLERLFGPGYGGRKLLFGALLAIIAALSFMTTTYRVTGEALLRGAEQRAITAPIDGYVDTAPARGGDRLEAGASLLTLDDRDIQIERLKLVTERVQLEQQRKQAVAARERASAKVFDAQIEQTNARLALLDEQISRTHVTMPFAGFVVSGDFSQSLGAPVRRGDLLYEVAPSDRYRVVVDVDESQLDEVRVGARGTLHLNALPEAAFGIVVSRITPVTKAREGGNYFEVEANIEGESARLRPGMRGVGKIVVGERKLVWVWTRALRAWLTVQWWRWWP